MIQFNTSIEEDGFESARGDALFRLAEKRISQGLAPPPEIYRVEYRRCIDWSDFPTWAQPIDPQAFDGCCHEG